MRAPQKTYHYVVELKSTTSNKINNISQLLLLIAFLAFTYKGIVLLKAYKVSLILNPGFRFLLFALLVLLWLLYCAYLKSVKKNYYYRLGLTAAALGWYLYPGGFYFFIAYLVVAVLEKPVKVSPEIAFDAEEIVMNTFPEKSFSWGEMNNVVMKDGMLTLDFKNNKLLQKEINEAVLKETEEEFNIFCAKMLQAES
ncbi:MAG: hypothetical protein J0I09_02220 [Sphingobacteriia bacterium]|nr:hypothetical protein [Sphingobacteriia bacterium]